MKISTITPCFKMKRYLKTFLDELPNQTIFDDIEIVLDHNEPTEEELEWVKDFQEKYPNRLKHIVVDEVDPIGISMNRCIIEASSDIVCIWNVDDLRTPDSLEKQVNAFNQNKELGVVHGDFVIVNRFPSKHGKYIDHHWTLDHPKELERGMILGPFFAWKKELCDEVGYFDEQLRSGADFDLAVRLAKASKVGMVYGVLGYYLDEGRGASTRGDSLQPIERTVIEVRYGIHDKIEQKWLTEERFQQYDPKYIVNFGKKIPVESLI